MAKVEEPTIDVKLFVDKEKKKVLFAESGKEFVDILFGFLTMPLGTIVRLLGKQSQMGCLDEVYKSVEDLSADFFQTKACKAMLLAPLNAAASHCSRLKINVDDTKVREVYACRDAGCCAHRDNAFSSVPDTICKCGKVMQSLGQSPQNDGRAAAGDPPEDGVFVKGCLKFIITDDLQVAPASTSLMLSLFEKFGVRDPIDLEKAVVNLTLEKINSLLKGSLTSKQPFTGYYFDVPTPREDASLYTLPPNWHEQANSNAEQKVDDVKIKILQAKNNSSLLYAEVGDDFVDLLFGLLSVPIGSMIKTFGQGSSKGCLDNLYSSINGSAKGCMKPECQSLLLAPRSWPFFGSDATKILQVEESAPNKVQVNSCFMCLKLYSFSSVSNCHKKDYLEKHYFLCNETPKSTKLCELNPKSPNGGGGKGEAYAYVNGGHMKFMVTDGLRVLPLALSTALQAVSDAKIKTDELVEKEISLSKFQVMEIQRASLMNHNALSFVLLRPKKKRKAES